MAFERRDVPIRQCACPMNLYECDNQATGEDRLCDDCRVDHRPDEEEVEWVEAG